VNYFEDFVVGELTDFDGTYLVTEDEIVEVGRRWDPQPFHVDPVAAADSVFGGLVASSVHLFAMAISLGVNAKPSAAVSSLGFPAIDNHAPVRPGDELSMRSRVLESRLSRSRPGLGIVVTRGEMLNQDRELVFSFENAALLRCRAEPAS
jgi:acyl dehydratase